MGSIPTNRCNLIHCALCMVVTFGGIALAYLNLNAEFVGFAQLLVYVGAVALLIVIRGAFF